VFNCEAGNLGFRVDDQQTAAIAHHNRCKEGIDFPRQGESPPFAIGTTMHLPRQLGLGMDTFNKTPGATSPTQGRRDATINTCLKPIVPRQIVLIGLCGKFSELLHLLC